MIEINNLNKKFQNNIVLNDLEIKIETGESAVVIGQSGTGKSVMLKCLLGLIKPDSGSVKINNKEIYDKNLKYLKKNKPKIGMLFQGGALFDSLPIWKNVGFTSLQNKVSEKICKIKAVQTLEKVGLGSEISDLVPVRNIWRDAKKGCSSKSYFS